MVECRLVGTLGLHAGLDVKLLRRHAVVLIILQASHLALLDVASKATVGLLLILQLIIDRLRDLQVLHLPLACVNQTVLHLGANSLRRHGHAPRGVGCTHLLLGLTLLGGTEATVRGKVVKHCRL